MKNLTIPQAVVIGSILIALAVLCQPIVGYYWDDDRVLLSSLDMSFLIDAINSVAAAIRERR